MPPRRSRRLSNSRSQSNNTQSPLLFKYGETNATFYLESNRDKFISDPWLHDTTIDLHSDFIRKIHINAAETREQADGGHVKRPRIKILDTALVQVIKGMGAGFDLPVLDGEHIFVPINKSSKGREDAGMHWSLLHIMKRADDFEPIAVRHYDPVEDFNTDEATYTVQRFAELYGWESWSQGRHLSLDVGPATAIPQTKNGQDCGLAVTWMLRQLVLRVLGGEALEPAARSTWWFAKPEQFDAGAERAFLLSLVNVLHHSAVAHTSSQARWRDIFTCAIIQLCTSCVGRE